MNINKLVSCLVGGALAVTWGGSCIAAPQEISVVFDNVKSISSKVSQRQCQALFPASPVRMPLSSDGNSVSAPVSLSPSNKLVSLAKQGADKKRGGKGKSASLVTRKWQGKANVSYNGGRTFSSANVEVGAVVSKQSNSATGQVAIGNSCIASFKSNK